MTPQYWKLQAMSDAELIAMHDEAAKDTSAGVNFYLEELHRRQLMRQAARALTYVAFVDAGFVRPRAAAAAGLDAEDVGLNGQQLVEVLQRGMFERFLRAYVYDANFREEDVERTERRMVIAEQHRRLREVRGIHLRLGELVGKPARQKGVDTRLILDMVDLGRQDAYDIAVLFCGDSDFAEAIETVQKMGKTVRLVVPDSGPIASSISTELLVRADDEFHIEPDAFARLVRALPKHVSPGDLDDTTEVTSEPTS